jgi:biofilm PGA synthesis N-glycosyltransferase PgaC
VIWVFWCAVGFIVYTYAGYLGWLWLRRRWRRRPVHAGPFTPSISVVMVVRNEERWLETKIQNLLRLDYPEERFELIIVSDGSTDRTEAILHEQARNPRVQAVLNELPRGKASGINDALQLAQGEIVIFTDARQTIEKEAVRWLLQNFADPDVGCVSGELMLGDPVTGEKNRGLGLYWRIEKEVRQLESAAGSVVGATGALYAVRREILTDLPEGLILDDVYIPMQVARCGKRVILEPNARAWDSPNLGAGREFSRKVRTLSGNYQLMQVAPWLLSAENPIRFEFVSHKLLRLAVPFALLTTLLVSAVLAHPFYRAAMALQLMFYALSLVGIIQTKIRPLAWLGDIALTFVMLNTAAAIAFVYFVTQKKVAWLR